MFNLPGADYVAIKKLELYLIENAGPDALLQLTVYRFNDRVTARALFYAARRGVHVEVLLDGGESHLDCHGDPTCVNPSFTILKKLNKINATDPQTWFRTCDGLGPQSPDVPSSSGDGCIGQDLNHNKILLSSDESDLNRQSASDVVFQSSSNNTINQYHHALNNALIVAERPTVYQDYEGYFQQLVAASSSTAPTASMRFTAKTGTHIDTTTLPSHDIATWSFPRSPSTDPVADVLGNVRTARHCANAVGGASGPSHTEVHAAISDVNGRPLLMKRLTSLEAAGCRVEVIYASMGSADHHTLAAAGVALHEVCTVLKKNDPRYDAEQYVHSKYILVAGSDRTLGANRRIVYTGSENWTNRALSAADNRMMRYVEPADVPAVKPKNSPLYDTYAANFKALEQISAANKEKKSCAAATI
jgi:hypothetical protein